MKLCTEFGPQEMNPSDFGDPLTFLLGSTAGQHLTLSNTLVFDQIHENLMTFPPVCILC